MPQESESPLNTFLAPLDFGELLHTLEVTDQDVESVQEQAKQAIEVLSPIFNGLPVSKGRRTSSLASYWEKLRDYCLKGGSAKTYNKELGQMIQLIRELSGEMN